MKTQQETAQLPATRPCLADAIPRQPDTRTEWLTFEAALGWDDPGSADRNWSRDVAAPAPLALVARLACITLFEAYEIPHPGALEYTAFRSQGGSIRFPTLRLRRRDPAPASRLAGPIPATVM